MDQIAIISDIHGNIPALESTLADIRHRGIEIIYCLVDLIGKGPDSDKVVDICQEVCKEVVRGNWDDYINQPTTKPSRLWHQNRLGADRLKYLHELPGVLDLTMSGQHVRLFHASQRSVHYRVYYWAEFDKLKAMFENTEFTGYTRLSLIHI